MRGILLSPATSVHVATIEKAVKTSIDLEISDFFFPCKINILYVEFLLLTNKKLTFSETRILVFFLSVQQY